MKSVFFFLPCRQNGEEPEESVYDFLFFFIFFSIDNQITERSIQCYPSSSIMSHDNGDDVVPLPPVVKIRHLYIGEIETLGYTKGGKELRSGINKREISEGKVKATNLGLEGDHIDKKGSSSLLSSLFSLSPHTHIRSLTTSVHSPFLLLTSFPSIFFVEFHGGPERVVHQFAQEDYPLLVSFIQSHSSTSSSEATLDPSLFHAGRFGENLSTDPGMNEKNVCIGDIYRAGLSNYLYSYVISPSSSFLPFFLPSFLPSTSPFPTRLLHLS
jgi:hypothetical protein